MLVRTKQRSPQNVERRRSERRPTRASAAPTLSVRLRSTRGLESTCYFETRYLFRLTKAWILDSECPCETLLRSPQNVERRPTRGLESTCYFTKLLLIFDPFLS